MKISEQTLLKRINRRLAHEGEQLHKTRGVGYNADLGSYYATDCFGVVVAAHVDPNEWAAEMNINAQS